MLYAIGVIDVSRTQSLPWHKLFFTAEFYCITKEGFLCSS